jgi:hypothetical protein
MHCISLNGTTSWFIMCLPILVEVFGYMPTSWSWRHTNVWLCGQVS